MEYDFDDPAVDSHPEDQTDRLGLLALSIDIIRRPSDAMRRLAAHPGRRWIAPLTALVIMSVVATVASFPASKAYTFELTLQELREVEESGASATFGNNTPEQMAEFASTAGRIVALIGAVIAPLIAALVVAAVLHFLGTIQGGQQTFKQMFTVTTWARVPLIFQSALRAVYLLAGGHYDPYTSGLEGLVAPNPLQEGAVASVWQPIVAQISVWNIWMLVLLVIAVRVVSPVSLRKALMAVGAYLLMLIVLGEVGVLVNRFMADFASNF